MVGGEREGRQNSVKLLRIPGDSDNSIVNSQVAKNLILATMHFCCCFFFYFDQVTRS